MKKASDLPLYVIKGYIVLSCFLISICLYHHRLSYLNIFPNIPPPHNIYTVYPIYIYLSSHNLHIIILLPYPEFLVFAFILFHQPIQYSFDLFVIWLLETGNKIKTENENRK